MINTAGHYVLSDEERAEKLRKAMLRHGKPFAVDVPLLKPDEPPMHADNLIHMKHYSRGEK